MSRLAIYESSAVSTIFAGLNLVDGRGEKFLKISSKGPAYVMEGPGADGHVARCGTNNNTYTLEFTFKGTSSELAKLSAIHIADRNAKNGFGVAPLLVKDGGGSTIIMTDRAWITKMPDQEFGTTKGDVTVEIDAIIEPGGWLLGGN